MAYRNGTYVAFHAAGTTDPTKSDIKYYNMLKGWTANKGIDFSFINSHDKTAGVRDSSLRSTLFRRLRERMDNSKQFLLILSELTKRDDDCVPYEISYAIDTCDLPIIAVYPGFNAITAPAELAHLWPEALAIRIKNGSARVIHVAFAREPILDAIGQFDIFNRDYPTNGYGFYTREAYNSWGIHW